MRVHDAAPSVRRRVRLPAVLVGALLVFAVALLVGVSLFVDVPVPSSGPPTVGIGTAVTPTNLGPAVLPAMGGR